MLGTSNANKLQLSVGWRDSYANSLYDYSHKNRSLNQALKPKEWLNSVDLTASYSVNSRVSLTGTIPVVFNRLSLLLPPTGQNSASRFGLPAAGLSDVSLLGRAWMLAPEKHPTQNISLGVGIKVPTGNWNPQHTYPDVLGNYQRKAVLPPSIIPGDGGAAGIFEVVSYKTLTGKHPLRGSTVLLSASYLMNPRNTNNTLSAIPLLGLASSPASYNGLTNSVADSYSIRSLLTMPIPRSENSAFLKKTRVGFSYRWEGVRQRDVLGGSRGFRQPGYVMAIAPFVSIPFIANTKLSVEIPITISGRILPSPEIPPGVPLRSFGLIAPVTVLVRLTRAI